MIKGKSVLAILLATILLLGSMPITSVFAAGANDNCVILNDFSDPATFHALNGYATAAKAYSHNDNSYIGTGISEWADMRFDLNATEDLYNVKAYAIFLDFSNFYGEQAFQVLVSEDATNEETTLNSNCIAGGYDQTYGQASWVGQTVYLVPSDGSGVRERVAQSGSGVDIEAGFKGYLVLPVRADFNSEGYNFKNIKHLQMIRNGYFGFATYVDGTKETGWEMYVDNICAVTDLQGFLASAPQVDTHTVPHGDPEPYISTIRYNQTEPLKVYASSVEDGYKNITYNMLGDSITEGVNATGGVYGDFIAEKAHITLNNYGDSGTQIAGIYTFSFSSRFSSMVNADLITVFGGTNDFGGNRPLGTRDDIHNNTFYGGLRVLMEGLLRQYPDAHIVFMTPIKRNDISEINALGIHMEQYVDAIIEMANEYGFPVIDLYRAPEADFTGNWGTHMEDKLHPNSTAHAELADYIYAKLQEMNIITVATEGDPFVAEDVFTVVNDGTDAATAIPFGSALQGATEIGFGHSPNGSYFKHTFNEYTQYIGQKYTLSSERETLTGVEAYAFWIDFSEFTVNDYFLSTYLIDQDGAERNGDIIHNGWEGGEVSYLVSAEDGSVTELTGVWENPKTGHRIPAGFVGYLVVPTEVGKDFDHKTIKQLFLYVFNDYTVDPADEGKAYYIDEISMVFDLNAFLSAGVSKFGTMTPSGDATVQPTVSQGAVSGVEFTAVAGATTCNINTYEIKDSDLSFVSTNRTDAAAGAVQLDLNAGDYAFQAAYTNAEGEIIAVSDVATVYNASAGASAPVLQDNTVTWDAIDDAATYLYNVFGFDGNGLVYSESGATAETAVQILRDQPTGLAVQVAAYDAKGNLLNVTEYGNILASSADSAATFAPDMLGASFNAQKTIRFQSTQPTAVPEGYSVVASGTVLLPTQLLEGNLTLTTPSALIPTLPADRFTAGGTLYSYISGSELHTGVQISARAYVTYEDASGNQFTVYSAEVASKSVNGMARSMATAIFTYLDEIVASGIEIHYTAEVPEGTTLEDVTATNPATIAGEDLAEFVLQNSEALAKAVELMGTNS